MRPAAFGCVSDGGPCPCKGLEEPGSCFPAAGVAASRKGHAIPGVRRCRRARKGPHSGFRKSTVINSLGWREDAGGRPTELACGWVSAGGSASHVCSVLTSATLRANTQYSRGEVRPWRPSDLRARGKKKPLPVLGHQTLKPQPQPYCAARTSLQPSPPRTRRPHHGPRERKRYVRRACPKPQLVAPAWRPRSTHTGRPRAARRGGRRAIGGKSARKRAAGRRCQRRSTE